MRVEDLEGTLWREGEQIRIEVVSDHKSVYFPGYDLGSQPFIIQRRGRFILLRYPGHNSWAGRGDFTYSPSRYLLLEVIEFLGEGECYLTKVICERPYRREDASQAKKEILRLFGEKAGVKDA